MRILLPYDIDTTGNRNPYLFLLLRELRHARQVSRVEHGYGWLFEEGEWDVIHLHWPEQLLGPLLPGPVTESRIERETIDYLLRRLQGWKARGTRIVMTVHNEKPHVDPSGMCEVLYREIYALADGFIHMGERSRELLADRMPGEATQQSSFVIPHGDYRWFPNHIDREEARKALDIDPDVRLMLAFGAIRTREELNLGIDAFKRAGLPKAVYLMAGKLPYPYKAQKQHFPVRRKLYLNRFSGRIRTDERNIPPGEVQHFLNAADLLFLPRFRALNSGNIPLGFTFGRVVAGPRYGVIGELLGQTGNPLFDPDDPASVARAIVRGFELAESDHGEKNRDYARRHMSWKRIGEMTVRVYRHLAGPPQQAGPYGR